MACIVTGFPSSIAALQFEWAWQNTHLTRHIAEDQRITVRETRIRVSPKTRRTRRHPARPRISLIDKLSNLHLLLRVPSFSHWPLEIRFFCEDVFQVWQRWCARVEDETRPGVRLVLDVKPAEETAQDNEAPPSAQATREERKGSDHGQGGVDGIDVGYRSMKAYVEKSLFLLAEGEATKCAVCTKELRTQVTTAVVCPKEGCRTASHMTCLAKRFLGENGSDRPLVPMNGSCPGCNAALKWIDLVKEMSLRIRGEKEVAQLMRKPRQRKTKVPKGKSTLPSGVVGSSDEEDFDDGLLDADIVDEPLLEDEWVYRDEDDDDMILLTTAASESRTPSPVRFGKPDQTLEMVIEDSDWDNAEVLD
ncbi:excinuclease abc c subunit [Lasallia pustulata]|uniref:Excinuclease abc c subunit n=1 Tax=Lasallia pustulata TaxID=136370 RepID=A0A1W5DEM2_9LECA|nr:excinuclease abc c subunit [Lasallia pustulata]